MLPVRRLVVVMGGVLIVLAAIRPARADVAGEGAAPRTTLVVRAVDAASEAVAARLYRLFRDNLQETRTLTYLDADRALFAGDYVASVAGYERVIDDDVLQEWGAVSGNVDPATERAYLAAFSRWRLALTYLQAGDSGNAQAQHNRLLVDFPGGSTGRDVVSLAEVFWAAYLPGTDIVAGCNAMVEAAKAAPSVHGFFNETYGYANPRWEAVDLCPFGE